MKQRYSDHEQTDKGETDAASQRQSLFSLRPNPNHWLFKTKIKEFPNNMQTVKMLRVYITNKAERLVFFKIKEFPQGAENEECLSKKQNTT